MSDEVHDDSGSGVAEQSKARGRLSQKLIFLGLLAAVAGALYWQLGDTLSLNSLAAKEGELLDTAQAHPIIVLSAAFLMYVVITAFAIPAATVFTLGIGLICNKTFAPEYGSSIALLIAIVLVNFASTTGATLSFLMSRYLLRDSIQNKFGDRLQKFNEALEREGAFYLFTLRLIPVVPFFVINLVMGLTPIRVRTFWWVSQVGMLAGTCVFVFAGSTIPSIGQIVDRSQLRTDEIQGWPEFMDKLRPTTGGGADDPARRIWDLLPNDARQVIATNSSWRELQDHEKDDEKAILLRGLNELMRSQNLGREKPSQDDKLKPQELSELNRRLLEQAFPDHILQPQPILPLELFVAFTLLGVFPLIVKKLMSRFRPPSPEQFT
jgi:uncharacterized membrane protein YdjX (TVP38/TMEM64 family)